MSDLHYRMIKAKDYWMNYAILLIAFVISGFVFKMEAGYMIYALGMSFLTALVLYLKMKNPLKSMGIDVVSSVDEALDSFKDDKEK